MTKISKSFQLLHALCNVHGPSGNEIHVKNFILDYVEKNKKNWKVQPQIMEGEMFQDSLILVFGEPRTAIFAHMDSVGFTVRYLDQLVPIGSPETENGHILTGSDSLGPIECELVVDKNHNARYKFGRAIERGTDLVFKCNFREDEHYIQSCYMDNRLGIY
ncbi:MAG: aminopeptidase, partial [Cyclobacteriaceae bacterium]|nr:aminopeptidase [Cyclobacteriaceae bacterium]